MLGRDPFFRVCALRRRATVHKGFEGEQLSAASPQPPPFLDNPPSALGWRLRAGQGGTQNHSETKASTEDINQCTVISVQTCTSNVHKRICTWNYSGSQNISGKPGEHTLNVRVGMQSSTGHVHETVHTKISGNREHDLNVSAPSLPPFWCFSKNAFGLCPRSFFSRYQILNLNPHISPIMWKSKGGRNKMISLETSPHNLRGKKQNDFTRNLFK